MMRTKDSSLFQMHSIGEQRKLNENIVDTPILFLAKIPSGQGIHSISCGKSNKSLEIFPNILFALVAVPVVFATVCFAFLSWISSIAWFELNYHEYISPPWNRSVSLYRNVKNDILWYSPTLKVLYNHRCGTAGWELSGDTPFQHRWQSFDYWFHV